MLTVGAQGGAAVSLQRGHIVRQTRGLIYYRPEALPGRSGSPLFDDEGSRVIGLVAWRTGDGHGLAMNATTVRSFVHGEVAEAETELPEDAIPLWQSSTRLILVTSAGCHPCELQKQSIPSDVRYETIDIARVNGKGYDVQTTPTLMVFVDGKLQSQTSGLLRGDGLQAFLGRWAFGNSPGNDPESEDDTQDADDFNPWSNAKRWERGTGLIERGRDRVDKAKTRFEWWLLAKWIGFAGGGAAITLPWFFFLYQALRKLRSSEAGEQPITKRRTQRRARKSLNQ